MMVQKENKIGEVVAQNFHAAKVFESYGLDFCCGGKKTIGEACNEKGIDSDLLINELNNSAEKKENTNNCSSWKADILADYIVNRHHTYVHKAIPSIEQRLAKVSGKHGERHPELNIVAAVFSVLKDDLLIHMAKEEKMLFPFIKQLGSAEQDNLKINTAPFGTINNPIKVMESEHDNAGNLMKEISRLTNGFTPPEDACSGFRVLYSELKEFEEDLYKHIHLENNVLFPKANELETRLLNIINTEN
jgi:regulator of cell morphogenesis and NO signaling